MNEELKLLWKCKKEKWGGVSDPAGEGSSGGCWSIGRGLVGSNVGGRG